MTAGLGIAALALFAFAGTIQDGNIGFLVPVLAVFAAGYALFQSPNNIEIMRGLPPAKSGIASSLSGTGRHFGMALGVAAAAIIFSVQFSLAGAKEAGIGAGPEMFASVSATTMTVAAVICLIAALPLFVWAKPVHKKHISTKIRRRSNDDKIPKIKQKS